MIPCEASSPGTLGRRAFVAGVAAAGQRILGSSERIRCATIGTGSRGCYLSTLFKEQGADVAAVCDVYEPHLQEGLKAASIGARAYEDYRRLLEDRSIDAVIIATPDHWHARMVIDTVESGKDAYIEKPMAHTIEEGFRMVDAVRRTNRVVQVGSQRRSYSLHQEARRIVNSPAMGDIRLVTACWLNHQRSLRDPVLKGKLDWERFLGPAPKRKPDPSRFLNWPHFWDYSGGMMVSQAAHIVDEIHWMMNSSHPLAVTCAGGKINLDGAEIPETTSMTIEYPENFLAVFTVGYKAMRYSPFNDQIQQYHGSGARFDLGRESYALYPQSYAVDLRPTQQRRDPGTFESASRAHIRNFLECLRTRQEPNATVEMGQSANIVLAMAMESLRSGRRMRWNSATRQMQPV